MSGPVSVAVVGVSLDPFPVGCCSMVYVIAAGHHQTSVYHGFFGYEARIAPVLVVGWNLVHLHYEYRPMAVWGTSFAYDYIAQSRRLSNTWFARCQ